MRRLVDRLGRAVGRGRRRGPPAGTLFVAGRCNVCGKRVRFFYTDPASYRESLVCEGCGTTSRYRSIARGLLEAIHRRTGIEAPSLAELPRRRGGTRLALYDTQRPFVFDTCAYPVPELLARCRWIDLRLSAFAPGKAPGERLARRVTNQNLERLSFPDSVFDIVVTSDVLEHVRLADRAHREIRRVLKPGGVYLFTVPHVRDRATVERVKVVDADDPTKDVDMLEREYHDDGNAEGGRALAYRSFGIDLDEKLRELGFDVSYVKRDIREVGVLDTELFFCTVL